MKAYNNKFQTNYTGRTFFEEVFVPLFFDHPKYMMTAGNSPLENPKLSWEDMIKGKKPFETAERRKERIDKMINKIESEKADASIAIGYGVVDAAAATTGQITNIDFPDNKEDIYCSWIGAGLGVGITGGLTILFNNEALLLDIYEGWKCYRQYLEEYPLMKGNQINTWNGRWLVHRYQPDFDETDPTAGFNPLEPINAGLLGLQTISWVATQRLKEYMIKGFTIDDERLKGNGGGNYWKELLDRIRDIRSSEKVLYRQVLDLYATSVDYNPHSEESVRFFKIVQNKLHYAAHGHTAAEVIYQRADAEKPFMGLTSFSGELPALKDIGIAKNYLEENELKVLNNLVSGYFDLAEINAIEHKPMYMDDYVKQLDSVLSSGNRKLLTGSGSVSHKQALEKAKSEYRKYQEITLTPVEKAYLESIKEVSKEVKRR